VQHHDDVQLFTPEMISHIHNIIYLYTAVISWYLYTGQLVYNRGIFSRPIPIPNDMIYDYNLSDEDIVRINNNILIFRTRSRDVCSAVLAAALCYNNDIMYDNLPAFILLLLLLLYYLHEVCDVAYCTIAIAIVCPSAKKYVLISNIIYLLFIGGVYV